MNDQIQKLIDELNEELEKLAQEGKTQIQQARISAEAQIAKLQGHIDQKAIDLGAEIGRLESLLEPEEMT